jgi:lysophospholipase L1-like esterase
MKRACLTLAILITMLAGVHGQETRKPTLFIIGDSTVNNSTKGQQGWGTPLAGLFDTSKIKVDNRARGGRSSRTFFTEGLWAKIAAELKPGDFVLMQFGHNDGGGLSDPRGRASIKGMGDQTQEVTDSKTGKKEMVHTFGWYMRAYVADTKAKGATPIVLSLIPRNIWKGDAVVRGSKDYGKWAAEAAGAEKALFIDFNEAIASHYEKLGKEKVDPLFFGDHTHTSPAGARLNATLLAEQLRRAETCMLREFLRP